MIIGESEVVNSSESCCFLGYVEGESSYNGGVAFDDGGIYTVYIAIVEYVSGAVGALLADVAAGDEHLSGREATDGYENQYKPVFHYLFE